MEKNGRLPALLKILSLDHLSVNPERGLEKIFSVLNGIENWDDFENRFLYGSGLSENTYRNSKSAIKQFFDWTATLPENKSGMMMHLAEITKRHIERFFDHQTKRTACRPQ